MFAVNPPGSLRPIGAKPRSKRNSIPLASCSKGSRSISLERSSRLTPVTPSFAAYRWPISTAGFETRKIEVTKIRNRPLAISVVSWQEVKLRERTSFSSTMAYSHAIRNPCIVRNSPCFNFFRFKFLVHQPPLITRKPLFNKITCTIRMFKVVRYACRRIYMYVALHTYIRTCVLESSTNIIRNSRNKKIAIFSIFSVLVSYRPTTPNLPRASIFFYTIMCMFT